MKITHLGSENKDIEKSNKNHGKKNRFKSAEKLFLRLYRKQGRRNSTKRKTKRVQELGEVLKKLGPKTEIKKMKVER